MLGKGLSSLIPPVGGTALTESPNLLPETQTPLSAVSQNQSGHISESSKEKDSESAPEKSSKVQPVPSKELKEKEAIFQIEVEKIKPNPVQPRKEFKKEELLELSQSIREFGIIQPIVVSKVEREVDSGTEVEYQLIAGERRWRAAKLAGLERVPAVIRHLESKKSSLEIALTENLQRSNLSPMETAKAYARLQDEFQLTQREIAARVGKSRESVANSLRLLNLPTHIQKAVEEGKISESQARFLLSIADPAEQEKFFQKAVNQKITVRGMKESVNFKQRNTLTNYLERQLEEKLGAPVKISEKEGKGKLMIKFFSKEEMDGLFQKILGEQ